MLDWLERTTYGTNIRLVLPPASVCVKCRARLLLCGKSSCPILKVIRPLFSTVKALGSTREIHGSSPPSVFVGKLGYPSVFIGPLVPPQSGDTRFLDYPEMWYGLSYAEIASIRTRLVRGMSRKRVEDAKDPDAQLLLIHDMLLSTKSSYTEMLFEKPPKATILLSDESPPYGPSGVVKKLRVSAAPSERVLEKVYYDADMSSTEAVIELYESGVPVTVIQKLFSAGMVGEKRKRKLVPTRWSITAVDDIVSRYLVEKIKLAPTINEYRVYVEESMGNKVVVVMAPGSWSFEWIEAWFPGTTWNIKGTSPEMIGDWEGFSGRTGYADEIGGCYYASRLAVAESLRRENRQATVIALREIYRDAVFPVGVWLVREIVRRAVAKKPMIFNDARESLDYAFSELKVHRSAWIRSSRLIKKMLSQSSLL